MEPDVSEILAALRGSVGLDPEPEEEDEDEVELLESDEEEFDENTPLEQLVINGSALESAPIDWIWPGRFAAGHLAAIVGPRGSGKSSVMFDMVARITSGTPWPDDPFKARQKPGSVLYIAAEDDPRSMVAPKLRAAGADMNKVSFVGYPRSTTKEARWFGEKQIRQWELAADKMPDLRLIAIDSLVRLLGKSNNRLLLDVDELLGRFVEMARERKLGIVVANATDKGSNGKGARQSVDVIPYLYANARMVWETEVDRERPRFKWFIPGLAGLDDDPGGLEFVVEPSEKRVSWNPEPLPIFAGGIRPTPARAMSNVDRAVPWLAQYLLEAPTLVPVRQVLQDGALAGHNTRALNHAKRRLGVVSQKSTLRFDGSWSWELPLERPKEERTTGPQFRHWWVGPRDGDEVVEVAKMTAPERLTPSPHCGGGLGWGAEEASADRDRDGLTSPHPIPPPHRGEGTGAKMTAAERERVTPSPHCGGGLGWGGGEASAQCAGVAPPLPVPPPHRGEGTATAAEVAKMTESHVEADLPVCLPNETEIGRTGGLPPRQEEKGTRRPGGLPPREEEASKVTERKYVVGGVTFYLPVHEETGGPDVLPPRGDEDSKLTDSPQAAVEVAKVTAPERERLTPSPHCGGGLGWRAGEALAHRDGVASPLPIPPPRRGEGTGTSAGTLAKVTGSAETVGSANPIPVLPSEVASVSTQCQGESRPPTPPFHGGPLPQVSDFFGVIHLTSMRSSKQLTICD